MARIYISYQHEDREFVVALAEQLRTAGHTLAYDIDTLSAGVDWRSTLDKALKTSEVFIVVISQTASKSQYISSEIGAARAYSQESGRMLIVPLVIDPVPLPLPLQDIHAIMSSRNELAEICRRIDTAISAFIGRRAAIDAAATETAQKIQNNAADYIRGAIDSLAGLESRDRRMSYAWYAIGFLSLAGGLAFAIPVLTTIGDQPGMPLPTAIVVSLKALIVVGLLGACAKYAFALGKSYASEALKCSDRMHAIRFGEFYLRAFGDKTRWEELKEVFQHWNIDRSSTFSNLDASSFDPKVVEALVELAKSLPARKG